MKNKIVIPILVLIILVGGGAFAYQRGLIGSPVKEEQSDQVGQQQLATGQTKPEKRELIEASPQKLVNMGRQLKCQWSGEDEGRGKLYTDGNKVRIDWQEITSGNASQISMINDGEWVYFWDPISYAGQKYNLDDFQNMQSDGQELEQEFETDPQDNMNTAAYNWERQYQASCTQWTVDPQVFTPPEAVEFDDMGEMMNMMQDQGSELPSSDVCQSLSGEAREQCLNALEQSAAGQTEQ